MTGLTIDCTKRDTPYTYESGYPKSETTNEIPDKFTWPDPITGYHGDPSSAFMTSRDKIVIMHATPRKSYPTIFMLPMIRRILSWGELFPGSPPRTPRLVASGVGLTVQSEVQRIAISRKVVTLRQDCTVLFVIVEELITLRRILSFFESDKDATHSY